MSLPEKYGRYQIKKILGKGGMATVYLAHDPRFGRDVALKAVATEFNDESTFRSRFEREARTIATLEHPSIVPVYDFGEDNSQLFLVMRRMPNGTLADRIVMGPMEGVKAIPIIRRVADALDHAHQNGVIHRDLKPANILFDEYERAYLSDFGIVKLAAEGTQADLTGSGVIGTPAYMSPEQIHGDQIVDGRSDIYTLGVILFEMLTGQKPYRADTPVKQMMAHVMEPIPDISKILPHLSPDTILVLQKALAKEKESRFQRAQELTAELSTKMTGQNFTPIPRSAPVEPIDHDSETLSEEFPTDANVYREAETLSSKQVAIGEDGEPEEQTFASQNTSSKRLPILLIGGLLLVAIVSFIILRGANQQTLRENEEIGVEVVEPTETVMIETKTAENPTAVSTQPIIEEAPTATVETETADAFPPTGSIGLSANDTNIVYERIGTGDNILVIVGGIHSGIGVSSVEIVDELKQYFQENSELINKGISIIFISNMNPDGALGTLANSNNVDLDRNWDCNWSPNGAVQGVTTSGVGGAVPFSEPETAVLQQFLLEQKEATAGNMVVLFFDASVPTGWVSAGGCGVPSADSLTYETLFSSASGYLKGDISVIQNQERSGKAIDWLDARQIPAIMVWLPNVNRFDLEPNLEGVLAITQQISK